MRSDGFSVIWEPARTRSGRKKHGDSEAQGGRRARRPGCVPRSRRRPKLTLNPDEVRDRRQAVRLAWRRTEAPKRCMNNHVKYLFLYQNGCLRKAEDKNLERFVHRFLKMLKSEANCVSAPFTAGQMMSRTHSSRGQTAVYTGQRPLDYGRGDVQLPGQKEEYLYSEAPSHECVTIAQRDEDEHRLTFSAHIQTDFAASRIGSDHLMSHLCQKGRLLKTNQHGWLQPDVLRRLGRLKSRVFDRGTDS